MFADDCEPPTVVEIARAVHNGTPSAVETIGASLDDVERCDPVLHFIDERHTEAAVNAAERLDRASDPGGPLAGLPFLIMARTPRVAIVARLVAADAIPIGTSSRHGQTGSRRRSAGTVATAPATMAAGPLARRLVSRCRRFRRGGRRTARDRW
jgi:hypothetical protein